MDGMGDIMVEMVEQFKELEQEKNMINGIMNTNPINLPNNLCKYSQKKMYLNSLKLIPIFIF